MENAFTTTAIGATLIPSLLGLDLSRIKLSAPCSVELRATFINLLDACAAAVCASPEFFPPEDGLILRCECLAEGGQPLARLRVRSSTGILLPVWHERLEASRAFAAWAGALRTSLVKKESSVGHIFWPDNVPHLELALIIASLPGQSATAEFDLGCPKPDTHAKARAILRHH